MESRRKRVTDSNIVKLLAKKGVSFNFSGDEHVVLDCWKCGRDKKLYYNVEKNIGDCKVCSEYFNLKDVFQYFGLKDASSIKTSKGLRTKIGELNARTTGEVEGHKRDRVGYDARDLEGFRKILLERPKIDSGISGTQKHTRRRRQAGSAHGHPLGLSRIQSEAYEYLRTRGLTDSNIFMGDFRYAVSGKYANRIIFPVEDQESRVQGFQARTFRNGDPKYLFSKNFGRSRFIYPGYKYGESVGGNLPKIVAITEGIFNSIAYPGFATFGKSLSVEQLHAIRCWCGDRYSQGGPSGSNTARLLGRLCEARRLRLNQRIVLIWDSDSWIQRKPGAMSDSEKTLRMLEANFREVRAIKLPWKNKERKIPGQPDDCAPGVLEEIIRKAFKQNKLIYEVKNVW